MEQNQQNQQKNQQKKILSIPDNWYNLLKNLIESDYFLNLGNTIKEERKKVKVFPTRDKVFRAFNLTPLDKVRVVILGMDPYPNEYKGEPVACGLAFAPSNREYVPPSLRMIHKNIKDNLYPDEFKHATEMNLENWATQGVFLLNAALTVRQGKAGSHLYEWYQFTNNVITLLSQNTNGLIFCFWGKDAQKFKPLVDSTKHYILEAPHPVAGVYRGGDWDCDHFQQINNILTKNNNETIEWL